MSSSETVSGTLAQSEYLRQRLNPQPGDSIYLHLKDLMQCLETCRTDEALSVLDYGCGGSPYRSLFPNTFYHRADYVRIPGMDFTVSTEGRLPEVADGQYDLVLSTQVLEHVGDPKVYLDEAMRVLKPGGKLLLSTHGVFPDHGCPYDYWRWTSDGLRMTLERSSFQVNDIFRLTCGVRAVLFWLGQGLTALPPESPSAMAFFIRGLRWVFAKGRGGWDRLIDRHTSHLAVMTDHTATQVDFSIGLFAVARKA